ncbi:MAG: HEAT repeat domain-containing protein [Phycisphaerales bacterium]|nr:HEAT repeat domain-containing protein [Phycisphaerales bacterium]
MLGLSVKRKLRQLRSDVAATRAAAVTALAEIGDPQAVPGLAELLQDEERALRVGAAQALGAIGHPSAVGPLIGALLAENTWEVRHEIVDALRKIGDPTAVNQLVLVLESDRDAGAREFAAWALRSFGWDNLTPAQQAEVAVMQDDWTLVRRLGASAIEPLRGVLRDGTPRTRRYAAEALAALHDARALNTLVECLDAKDAALRTLVAQVLEEKAWARLEPRRLAQASVILGKWPAAVSAGEAAIGPLSAALATADRACKRQIVEALAAIGGAEATTVLLAVAHDEDVAVRLCAAHALAAAEDPSAEDALLTALADEDPGVRRAAAGGLKRLGWEPPNDAARARLSIAAGNTAALLALGAAAADELIDDLAAPTLRSATIEMLAALGAVGTDALLRAIAATTADVRQQALEALAVVGNAQVVPRLTLLFEDADVEVPRRSARLNRLGWQPPTTPRAPRCSSPSRIGSRWPRAERSPSNRCCTPSVRNSPRKPRGKRSKSR